MTDDVKTANCASEQLAQQYRELARLGIEAGRVAREAYQFQPTSYTHAALSACLRVEEQAKKILAVVGVTSPIPA